MSRTSNKYLQRLPMGMGMVMIFFFFFYFIEITYEQRPPPYIPVENIIIDCGSSGEHIAQDKRSWNGDIDSKFFPLEGKNKASAPLKAVERTIALDPVPYETARLSLSEFTYTVPVTPGPKFVRLYFFSATYRDFNRSKAFFEVRIDKYTLLKNFSASLTADALNIYGIKKEYILTVEKSPMKITFTPTSSQAGGAFAFINGIEIVSMPSALYYSNGRGLAIVGQEGRFFTLTNNTAMETMYRINIGGNTLSPIDDTGMFRQWNTEEEYLVSEGLSVQPITITRTPLKFRDNISSYAAPDSVYKTGRSTGNKPNKALLRSYNLTWEFSVDSKFRYMLRLHFCEINKEFTEVGDRVFYIYIADDRVEKKFDIINFAHGQFVPYYKDYLWFGNNSDQKKVKLSVALQANPDDYRTTFVDAILNGLEIFKLNDDSGNLAGLNPDSPNRTAIARPSTDAEKGKSSLITIIGVVFGIIACMVLISVLSFFISQSRRKVKDSASTEGSNWWDPIFCTKSKSRKKQGSSLPLDLCRYFSLAEIKVATTNFDSMFIIGRGGFGNVYKGYIDGGTIPVAIKRLKHQSLQGGHEFKTEIEMLSYLRHLNLVSLIGYCNEESEMILVYEYMVRGTLSSHLYNTDNSPLSWKQRLQICLGVANGLYYLHEGVNHMIIHRDVKTTNILLSERLVAKISDFGLSKMVPTTLSKTHVSTMVKGSFGYLDPEYFKCQQLTEKSDVYSFGVVLCEVLCGRPPILRNVERRKMSLSQWFQTCYLDKILIQIIDPYLNGKIAPECLNKYGEIAMSCMLDNGADRPSMKEVVRELELAMQLQNNAEENIRFGGEPSQMNPDGTVRYYFSWEDPSGAVFSDIKNLEGRP
ncbi:receptor-like protein kinase FERONIA [Humulus lupulus]|uniref:receptor-like protein kinase FERONIA n=1 Tax=Humulus lupulus TaxID=3486 RepID=UPI002B400ABB|nr:receptor-like protein kinase FERONIA [Humulus lupulus]